MHSVLALFVLTSGCSFYFDDGDDEPSPPICEGPTVLGEYRDPQTGVCETLGYGGCHPDCSPCDPVVDVVDKPFPNWAACYGECDGLGEDMCQWRPGCLAAYTIVTAGGANDARVPQFRGCWGVAPNFGPVHESCPGLDAYDCSTNDHCSPHYEDIPGQESQFRYCADEPPPIACGAKDCGPDAYCDRRCHDDGSCELVCISNATCELIDCGPGYECAETCTSAMGDVPGYCEAQCMPTTSCEAQLTEMACVARDGCRPVYDGDNCICYPSGCSCEILTYERCESQP